MNTILTSKFLRLLIVTSAIGLSVVCSCKEAIFVESLEIDVTELNMTKGQEQFIKVTVAPSGKETKEALQWETSNENVVRIDKSYAIATGPGKAEITVKSPDGTKSAVCKINVISIETDISIFDKDIYTAILTGRLELADRSAVTSLRISFNTKDNYIEMGERNRNTPIVVSSDLHMREELKLWRRAAEYCYVIVADVDGKEFKTDRKYFTSSDAVPAGAVDLGLSVLWGECNVGASKPEEFGDYYAWGEIEPYYTGKASASPIVWKSGKTGGYDWPSYRFCKGRDSTLTKYCWYSKFGYEGFLDNINELEVCDDVANIKLHGGWGIPSGDEWEELVENCSLEQCVVNEIKGCRLTSKTNGNSIFLPAGREFNGIEREDKNVYGYFWTSELANNAGDSTNEAQGKVVHSRGVFNSPDIRCKGRSIRPVAR